MIMNFLKKVPAGMMIVPLLIGAVLNTFFPQALQLGSLTTATFSNAGAATAMGIQLVCLGTTLQLGDIGRVLKRGGILLVQIAVGSLYMFSVPRGYADGFSQWVRQVLAICLTAFLQTTLLYMGLMTMQSHMLLGLGIMLSANEVPRIAQQFGLDSSVRVNMMSVVHTTSTAVNLARGLLAR